MHSDDGQRQPEADEQRTTPITAEPEIAHAVRSDAQGDEPTHDSERDAPRCSNKPASIDLPWSFDLFAFLAAAAAIGSAVFAGCQFQLTREAMMLDGRAWVVATNAYVEPFPIDSASRIAVDFTNSGSSPAIGVREIEIGAGFSQPCETQHEHGALPPDYIPLAAEGVLAHDNRPATREHAISATDRKRLTEDKASYFVWGGLEYVDIFRRRHILRYCFALDHNMAATVEKPLRVGMGWCDCHNNVE